jgi:hypothetical protein
MVIKFHESINPYPVVGELQRPVKGRRRGDDVGLLAMTLYPAHDELAIVASSVVGDKSTLLVLLSCKIKARN